MDPPIALDLSSNSIVNNGLDDQESVGPKCMMVVGSEAKVRSVTGLSGLLRKRDGGDDVGQWSGGDDKVESPMALKNNKLSIEEEDDDSHISAARSSSADWTQ
ncbi:hypothetical protein Q3G72_026340 [Acer saccharum]|nr:hypothetical protein Q3G72_026340 [Acer saccharum]